MLFNEFISQLADRLPFGVTFNVSPDASHTDEVEITPTLILKRYNDLTVSETWFGNIIAELNSKKSAEAQIEMKLLAAKFKDFFDLKYGTDETPAVANISDALKMIFSPVDFLSEYKEALEVALEEIEAEKSPVMKEILQKNYKVNLAQYKLYMDILDSGDYADFLVKNTETYQKIADLSKMIESDLSIKWVTVTFFLMSRYYADWDFDKTARLPMSVIDKVYEFYLQELNKGMVAPEIEPPKTEETLGEK